MTRDEISDIVEGLIREGKLYPPGTLLCLLNPRTRTIAKSIDRDCTWNKVSLLIKYDIDHLLLAEAKDIEQVYDWILCERLKGDKLIISRGEYTRYAHGAISPVGPEHEIEVRQFGEMVLS